MGVITTPWLCVQSGAGEVATVGCDLAIGEREAEKQCGSRWLHFRFVSKIQSPAEDHCARACSANGGISLTEHRNAWGRTCPSRSERTEFRDYLRRLVCEDPLLYVKLQLLTPLFSEALIIYIESRFLPY